MYKPYRTTLNCFIDCHTECDAPLECVCPCHDAEAVNERKEQF